MPQQQYNGELAKQCIKQLILILLIMAQSDSFKCRQKATSLYMLKVSNRIIVNFLKK